MSIELDVNNNESDKVKLDIDLSLNVDNMDVPKPMKKIVWIKKQEFPFFDGSKNLFTFLLKPYLSNKTLAILAGTCKAMREYVIKDLEQEWFQQYLELYERGRVAKYVRNGPCTPFCCDTLWNLRVQQYWYQSFTDRKVYDDNNLWWDELPENAVSEAKKNGTYKRSRRYGNNHVGVYKNKTFCTKHYTPEYYDAKDKKNNSKKRRNVDYYRKVIFYKFYQGKNAIGSSISKLETKYRTNKYHLEALALVQLRLKTEIDKLKIKDDFIKSLKNN